MTDGGFEVQSLRVIERGSNLTKAIWYVIVINYNVRRYGAL